MPDQDQNRPSVGQEPIKHDPRLEALDAKLDAAHVREATRTGKNHVAPKGQSQGMRVMSELIGAPLGGAIIGWFLDSWFHTKPFLLLVMLFLGFAVAIRNIYKLSKQRPK
jgi:ATP synthase protein I